MNAFLLTDHKVCLFVFLKIIYLKEESRSYQKTNNNWTKTYEATVVEAEHFISWSYPISGFRIHGCVVDFTQSNQWLCPGLGMLEQLFANKAI